MDGELVDVVFQGGICLNLFEVAAHEVAYRLRQHDQIEVEIPPFFECDLCVALLHRKTVLNHLLNPIIFENPRQGFEQVIDKTVVDEF